MNIINILITGSGGQGVVLTGEILSKIFIHYGLVPNSAINHGFSQRGGYVLYHLRISHQNISPIIEHEKADYLLYLNKDDDKRYTQYLSEKTKILSPIHMSNQNSTSKKFNNTILIGMFLKDFTIDNREKTLLFPLKDIISILEKNIKKYKQENIDALKMGFNA